MKPNLKSFLAGAVAIALLWAATAVATNVGDAGDAAQGEISTQTVPAPLEAEQPQPDRAEQADAQSTPTGSPEANTPFSDLTTISVEELPIEAIDTLDLIASGGPYPFSKDDSTFQNREGILPGAERGHYREYTVVTPGEHDRGARRIVAGADGGLYYTDDHYDSFREIVLDQ